MRSCENCGWSYADVPCIGVEVVSPDRPCEYWTPDLDEWVRMVNE